MKAEEPWLTPHLRRVCAILTLLAVLWACLPAIAHKGWHVGYNSATDRYCASTLVIQWCGAKP